MRWTDVQRQYYYYSVNLIEQAGTYGISAECAAEFALRKDCMNTEDVPNTGNKQNETSW